MKKSVEDWVSRGKTKKVISFQVISNQKENNAKWRGLRAVAPVVLFNELPYEIQSTIIAAGLIFSLG